MFTRATVLLTGALSAMVAHAAEKQVPAFPGAEGYGAVTRGGRGGRVIEVTSLADKGPGTFRAALEAEGPRTVVFRVAGLVTLESPVKIAHPFITVAGQTAPGDGICVRGHTTEINTHEVILRHLRFRRGNLKSRDDAVGGYPVRNIILDHCSFSWGLDENVSLYRWLEELPDGKVKKLPAENVTIQWCISSEALNLNNHAFGATWGGRNVSFHHNLFACNTGRNPSIGYGDHVDFRNNVIFNWVHRTVDGGDASSWVNVVANYYKPGPATLGYDIHHRIARPQHLKMFSEAPTPGKWFVAENFVAGHPEVTRDNWAGGVQFDEPDVQEAGSLQALVERVRAAQAFPAARVTQQRPEQAYELVLAQAGATLPKRDLVDQRIIEQVRTGRMLFGNGIILTPADVGGWPEYTFTAAPADSDHDGMPDEWERKHGLNPNDAGDGAADTDKDGFTNLEEFLNGTHPRQVTEFARHFLGRGFVGKAMVVSIDKATALKMHDKVRKHWAAETERVKKELARLGYLPKEERESTANQERVAELSKRLDVLKTTDMALIVSPGQNEIPLMKKLGLDIEAHRKRMNDSDPGLDEKFKDTTDPLRIVFVCAMWLTGFDAPSCSTVYLDKPMRNHTLMQTIARANRVFPGKHSGMIVDYANVFASLEKALAIYGAGKDGKNPVKDKAKLVTDLRKAVDAATTFCATRQVILPAIEQLVAGSMQRLQKLADAVDALISPDPLRREFLGHERLVSTLYNAVKPDVAALEFAGRVACLTAIGEAIRAKLNPNPADITEVMGDIGKLLDASITGVDMPAKPAPVMDLSKIDFEALRSRFKESKHQNTDLEVLKAAIRAQLEKLIRLNKTRADFADKFEELIESYNTGSRNIEELFEELLKLTRNLSEEQQRHVRENMSEEELVIFDILTRPAPELNVEERAEVKKVARLLLERMKQLLVLDWRQRSVARSQLKLAIEDTLDTGLPRAYDKPLYEQKCSALFEHVFESYPERDAGTYASAA